MWKFGEDMYYQTQMTLIFVTYFSDIVQYCQPAQVKGVENQKSSYVRINYDNIPNDKDRRQTEFQNYRPKDIS